MFSILEKIVLTIIINWLFSHLALAQQDVMTSQLRAWEYSHANEKLNNDQLVYGSYLYYLKKNFQQSLLILEKVDIANGWPRNFLELQSLNLLQLDQYMAAKRYWQLSSTNQRLAWQDFSIVTKENVNLPYIAYIIPGSGLIMEGQYSLGLGSMVVNGLLLYGVLDNLYHKNYALSFLLLFFELPFYKGSIDITKKLIAERNNLQIQTIKETWINNAQSILEFNLRY